MRNIMFICTCLTLAIACEARIIIVNDDGPADFNNIQAAIDDANSGDVVVVLPGTYKGPGNRDIDFGGRAITVSSTDPTDPSIVAATIIDCNGTEAEPHNGFIFDSGEGASSVLDGLTIINSWKTPGRRGAIYCEGSRPVIRNCNISRNHDDGIYCDNSRCQIINCTIKDNYFEHGADGIYCDDWSHATISNCIIKGNGDGIACYRSNATITGCTITENRGAGIALDYSEGVVEGCVIESNRGGGIICDDCNPSISNCRIRRNFAQEGAGINCRDADPTILNCVIADNFAGGGICCGDGSEPRIIGCVIAKNSALKYGGGIYCDGGAPRIVNCTITQNIARKYGGGICGYYGSSGSITNCVVWDNNAEMGPQIALRFHLGMGTASSLSVSYCDIEGGKQQVYLDTGCTVNWGLGNIEAEPMLGFVDDYHLIAESPCIDGGTNNPPGGLSGLDLDGNVRPQDGDGDGNDITDIGAYEFNALQPSIALSAEYVEVFTQEGTEPNQHILSIRNCGGGTLVWEIVEDCDWLGVAPASGSSAGEVNNILLDVHAAGLTHGDYSCEIEVVDEQAMNNPRTAEVMLHINDTLSVPTEYGTIQAAIDEAVDGDVVLVGDGRYTGEGNRDINLKGKAITVKSENGPNDCIIDCNGQARGFYLEGMEKNSSVIEGFAIINGYCERVGAGILCNICSSPTIRNCIITNCTDEAGWGAIFCGAGTVIKDCVIAGNNCGGIYLVYSNGMVKNCTISENTGTGVTCGRSCVTVESCTVKRNRRGIHCYQDFSTINGCTITGNVITEHLAIGGGVTCFQGSHSTITNCLIAGNSAALAGGGVYSDYTNIGVQIDNCTITGNRGGEYGGGICTSDAFLGVSNSIVWGNSAQAGAQIGILGDYGNLIISYSDVRDSMGDIYIDPNSTINWGVGNINIDPCFVEAGFWDPNGTPSDANDDFWVEGDYHMLAGSPCIDAGDPNYDPEPNATDIDGEPRVMGGRVDMGADEVTVLSIDLNLDSLWIYQNLPGATGSNLTASALITYDPNINSGYSYEWEIVLAGDVSVAPVTIAGGGAGDGYWTFAARGCDEPGGLSDSGQVFTVRVTVTGDDYGNTGQTETEFGIALLGDTNNDGVVNVADRSIANAFWRTGAAGPYTLRDCDVNCDGVVNVADRSIANAIWRGTLGQNSVSSPCPLR